MLERKKERSEDCALAKENKEQCVTKRGKVNDIGKDNRIFTDLTELMK